LLALNASKHVLCEKPFTVNAPQTKILTDVAKQKNLFLMEAVWTRFFPLSTEVRELIASGKIGEVQRLVADLSLSNVVEESFPDHDRMVNMNLAGGALLDLGLYSLTWVFQVLYHLSMDKTTPGVVGHMLKYPRTGCDESTTVICQFPSATGIAMTSMRIGTDPDGRGTAGPAIRIYGTLGEIQVSHPAYRPDAYKLIPLKGHGEVVEKKFEFPGGGHGMFWQADDSARAIRDGKLECDVMPLHESLAMVEVMDEIRKQFKLEYPAEIESTAH
jgi:predicted dehydrogenase